ncbi:hypothetical protein [Streptomyces zaomyceticus]|uniref:hypothetical protein n=1 Tax=Streptomyces zaomyceticus TaxID=68286 RepID=UPI002E155BC0|nr:hypothetical protein OG237_42650 [Streptomyces zaomyceticus]
MDTEQQSALLLLAIYQQSQGSTQEHVEVDELPEWGDLDDDRLLTLIQHLKHVGMVADPYVLPVGTLVQLTPHGVVKTEQLLRDRDRPIIRYDTALNGLVTAATDKFPRHRLEVQAFLVSRHARILDTVLTLDEIFSAIEFLEDEKLVTVERGGGRPVAVTLTSQGRLCGWTDNADVRGFLAGQQPSGIHQNWSVTVNGGAPQIGPGNVQNNTFGYDLAQVMQLVREVHDLVPSMNLPEPVREQIDEDVEALEREAKREKPQPTRIRRLLEALQEALAQSVTHSVASMAVNYLLKT